MKPANEIGNVHFKVLVIEDNFHDAKLVELYLQEMDLIHDRVTVMETMASALELLKQDSDFDIIISDLTLPDTRGVETIEALVSAHSDQAIIIQTGLNDKEIGLLAVKAGAQDFLVKGSYQPEDLAKTVRYAIERKGIMDRLEKTQRQANIGNFEVHLHNGLISGSAEYCRMLGLGEKSNSYYISEILTAWPGLSPLFEAHSDHTEETYLARDVQIEFAEGQKKWFAVNGKLSADGSVLSGLLQDITSRREIEEMRRQNEVAQQATMMKEQFIASVSHEMRTPMNAILGMSNLLLDYDLPEEQQNYIKSIKHSSELLLGIVNDILTISSLQNNAVHFEDQDFNLHELLANILNIVSYKIHEKGLMFDLQIDEQIDSSVVGDKLRLNQILLNLVGNAIKFTDKGSVQLKVILRKRMGNSIFVEFHVTDTGIGIPADKLDAVFESFTRIKYKDRLYEGTGLGLSIARKLIEQQGGWIRATSEIGQGSTFSFQLPLKVSNANEHANQTHVQDAYIDDATQFKVLLAEDNKLNQIVAMKTIERKFPNAEIDLATNGQEAIDKIMGTDYHVVLMDLQMPVMDGTEAVNWLRTQAPKQKSKHFIIAMTAHAHIGEIGQIDAIFMDDFVLKPFEPDQLYSKLSKYVALALAGETSSYGK